MLIRVTAESSDFAHEWPLMAARSEARFHAFQARDYLEAWRRSMGAARGAQLRFVRVGAEDGTCVMLVPLAIEKRRGVRVLSFPDGGVVDYGAPVLFPAASEIGRTEMLFLWRRITSALPPFDAALFEKMPASIGGIPNPFCHLSQERFSESGHVLELRGDWQHFVTHRLHRPKDSRRKRRRLSELGALRFVIGREQAERQRLLDALIAQKTRRYMETRGVNGFDRPGYRAYFRTMTDAFAASGEVHLSGLELDGEIIATHWGIVLADRFYCLMLANSEGPWAQYSPGRILLEELIAWCYGEGIAAFDLGMGDGAWKDKFRDLYIPLWRADLAQSLAGKAYIEAARLRRAMRASRQATHQEGQLESGGVA